MAHIQQTTFVKGIFNRINFKSVLEIGSYDVNGSIRAAVGSEIKYFGVDLKEGPSVDLVYNGIDLRLKEKFDIVLCCEVFEHDLHYINTFKNMYNHLNNNGFFIFTCASVGRLEHGTDRTNKFDSPGSNELGWNYYKNLKSTSFSRHLDLDKMFSDYFFIYHSTSNDLYFLGLKGDAKISQDLSMKDLKKILINEVKLRDPNLKFDYSINGILKALVKYIDYPIRFFLMYYNDGLFQNYMIWRKSFTRRLKSLIVE